MEEPAASSLAVGRDNSGAAPVTGANEENSFPLQSLSDALFPGPLLYPLQGPRQHCSDTLAFAELLIRWPRCVLPAAIAVSSQ